MSRCPYCGQETQRTTDWACRWCGHPLASGSYKKIDKSYRALLEERGPLPEPVPLEPEFEIPSEPVPLETEESPAPELTSETTPQALTETEPVVTLEPEPEPLAPQPEPYMPPEPLLPDGEKPLEPEPLATVKPKSASKKPKSTALKKPKSTSKKPKAPRKKAQPPKPTGSEVTITVEQLFADYKANAVAADARYQGRTIQVVGIVDSVDKDMLDNPFVKLSSVDKNEMLRMRCTFPKESEERLVKLTAGQEVTVRGSYDGYLVNILLKDCVLAEE